MLDRLMAHTRNLSGTTELRWHANHASRLFMRKGTLLENTKSQSAGTSARVYRDGVFGFAALPQDDDAAIEANLAAAADNAALVQRPGAAALALPLTAPGQGSYDYRTKQKLLSANERVDVLRRLDAMIKAKYPSLVNWDLMLGSLAMEKALVTSEGASTYSYVPRATLYIGMSIQANDGIVELYDVFGGFGDIEDHFLDLDGIDARIDELHANLRAKAEGTQCEAGDHEVVLDSSVAGILAHEAIGHTCEGDSVLAGSVAGDNVGALVASEKITLGDYAGRGPDGKSNFVIHVDDEGTPCEDVTIIENGVLKNFLHSKETARRLDAAPTGNARAFAFADEPLVRMRNTAILPGTDKLSDMIGAVEHGYYFKRATNGQADWTSEFMFGINCGYEIRNGKLGRAIRDTTISGVAFDMLKTVTHVGDKLEWSIGGMCGKKQPIPVGMGGPALKCRLTVGGQG
jgi:TldD protein